MLPVTLLPSHLYAFYIATSPIFIPLLSILYSTITTDSQSNLHLQTTRQLGKLARMFHSSRSLSFLAVVGVVGSRGTPRSVMGGAVKGSREVGGSDVWARLQNVCVGGRGNVDLGKWVGDVVEW